MKKSNKNYKNLKKNKKTVLIQQKDFCSNLHYCPACGILSESDYLHATLDILDARNQAISLKCSHEAVI